ncbi:unnamed protein product, partial [Adineta steineri]
TNVHRKPQNGIVQVPFELNRGKRNETTFHQGFSYIKHGLAGHSEQLVNEVFAWIWYPCWEGKQR